ncbi:MAG: hypothetical protein U0441_10850 [Polyangiaceae bacterium]
MARSPSRETSPLFGWTALAIALAAPGCVIIPGGSSGGDGGTTTTTTGTAGASTGGTTATGGTTTGGTMATGGTTTGGTGGTTATGGTATGGTATGGTGTGGIQTGGSETGGSGTGGLGTGGMATGGSGTGGLGTGGMATGGSGTGGLGTGGMATGGSGTGGMGGAPPVCVPGEAQSCYDGPPGTQGVAACKGGLKTCDANGQWSACVGEVLPQVEDCTTPADEDCNAQPCIEWTKTIQGASSLSFEWSNVAVDYQGNVLVTTSFSGTVDFGDGPTTQASPLAKDAALVKYDRFGNLLWKIHLDSQGWDSIYGIDTDPQGNIGIAGMVAGPTMLGPYTLSGSYVAKLDPNGTPLWVMQGPGAYGKTVRMSAQGDVFVAGDGGSAAVYGNVNVPVPNNSFFVMKFASANGNVVWGKAANGLGFSDTFKGMTVDAAGAVTVVGLFSGSWLGFSADGSIPNDIANPGGAASPPFVGRWDANGNFLGGKAIATPTSGACIVNGVGVDAAGYARIGGYLWGSSVFPSGTVTGSGNSTVPFFVHDQTVGAGQTNKAFSQLTGGASVWEYATDNQNEAISWGYYTGTPDLGSGPFSGAKTRYIAKMGANDTAKWHSVSTTDGEIKHMALGKVTGESAFVGVYTFPFDYLPNAPGMGLFLLKFGK